MSETTSRWVIGVTGASGIRYASRLIQVASLSVAELHIIFSDAALRVLAEEQNICVSQSRLSTVELFGEVRSNVKFFSPRDFGAPSASGSVLFDGMVVVPCSMGSLAAIANGVSQHLVHRAADVALKERRKLILVPRETPLSTIHLQNMLQLAREGATILPAMPGFYQQPASVDDVVDSLVMKILDHMGIKNSLTRRWDDILNGVDTITSCGLSRTSAVNFITREPLAD